MRTQLQLCCLSVIALSCGGLPPSMSMDSGTSNGFAIAVASSVKVAAGTSTTIDVSADRDVTLKATIGGGLTAEVDGLRVKVFAPSSTAGTSSSLELTATDARALTASASVRIDVQAAPKQASRASNVHVRLDSFFYADGQRAKVVVDLGGRALPSVLGDVVLVSSESNDVEQLTMRVRADGLLESVNEVPVKSGAGAGIPSDGTLTLPPGGVFFAFFGMDLTQPGYADLESGFVSDFGVLDGARTGTPASRVVAELMTPDEKTPIDGARPVATIIRTSGAGAGAPLQLATHELVLFHADDAELQRFLVESKGTLVRTEEVDGDKPFASLIEVDPSMLTAERLSIVRALAGDEGEIVASQSSAQAIYGMTLMFRLEGFVVAVNPRLQFASAPTLVDPELNTITNTMKLVGSPSESRQCIPNSSDRPCTLDVPALWGYLDVMDLDRVRIKTAVLDMGFAPNADFRTNDDGGIDQCDFSGRAMRCAPGAALGPPTVGASFFGARVWHGTGVATTIGGIVDNGFGATGVGGQLVVPMLYKYDLGAYAFDIGRGIRQALVQGAQVINISAGYPCTIVTAVGPDFDVCSESGRLGICGVVTAVAHAAALAFCTSPLAGIPIAGAAICGGLSVGAIIATDACISTLAYGNVRSTMASAVNASISQGVPVVASAGNIIDASTFPDIVSSLISLGEMRTEAWGVIPATLPGVICVGAAEGADMHNTQLIGSRIDVWAPSRSAFIAPDDMGGTFIDHVNATSGAAPFVTGLIATMQAANPSLDPARNTAAQRTTAVRRVRDLLVDTAHSNATLTARGFANEPQRRNLVDPLAALLAAADGAQPNLSTLGYDLSFNFNEADGDDDVAARARPARFDTFMPGTLWSFDSNADDLDFILVPMPVMTGRTFGSEVTVRWLGDESISVQADGAALGRVTTGQDGPEHVTTYPLTRGSGARVVIRLSTTHGADVPYRIRFSAPVVLEPTVRITEPVLTAGATVCANRPVQFRATVTYPGSTRTETTATWYIDGAFQLSSSLAPSFSLIAGSHVVTATSFGGSDSLSVTAVNCTVIAEIVTPVTNIADYGEYDAVGPFLDISFSGRALDASGNVLPSSSLVFEWSTNRGELEPGAPSTGAQVLSMMPSPGLIRLHGRNGSVAEQHVITLTIRATAGGPILSTDSILVTVESLI